MSKAIIYYHRAYRKITGSGWIFLVQLLAVTLPISFLILIGYPFITKQMSLVSLAILSPYYEHGALKIIEDVFLLGNVSLIDIDGTYPSALMSLINFLVSLSLILFLPFVKKGKNIAIYFVFLAAINLCSALFFTLSPYEFPYTGAEFSKFYLQSEISMWLFIPFILGMAVTLLPTPISLRLILIFSAIIYSIVFGTLRYIIFLFIISKCSVIYMALLFFAFGPLIDFVYIVGIYSFYNNRLASNLKSSNSIWKWSY
jgi:hypothetical protein